MLNVTTAQMSAARASIDNAATIHIFLRSPTVSTLDLIDS